MGQRWTLLACGTCKAKAVVDVSYKQKVLIDITVHCTVHDCPQNMSVSPSSTWKCSTDVLTASPTHLCCKRGSSS